MIAGLSFQVVSLFLFMSMCADFAFAVSRQKGGLDPAHTALRATAKFRSFVVGMISPGVCRNVHADLDPSTFHRNAVHLRPILFPCRRAQTRLRRQARKPRSELHDPRRLDGSSGRHVAHHPAPGRGLPGQLGPGKLQNPCFQGQDAHQWCGREARLFTRRFPRRERRKVLIWVDARLNRTWNVPLKNGAG